MVWYAVGRKAVLIYASRKSILLALILLVAGVCVASSPAPFNIELEFVNRIFAATQSQPSQQVAFSSLTRIAEGHPEAIDAGVAGGIGLKLEGPELGFLRDPSVRAYAIQRIRETGLQEGLDYLANITPGGLGPDETGQILPAVQIALRNAQLRRISDPLPQIEFLEKTTEEKSAAQSWAVSNSLIVAACPRFRSFKNQFEAVIPHNRARMRFCSAGRGSQVVQSNSNRVKALGAVRKLVKADPAND